MEHGGHGGVTAAPIVKQMMEAYFRKGQPAPALPEVQKKPGVQKKVEAPSGAPHAEPPVMPEE